MKLMGVDPGGTSGLCLYDVATRELKRIQIGPSEHHCDLRNLLSDYAPNLVVTERFDYRRRQEHAELISVEYIGVMKEWCSRTNTGLVQQQQLKGHRGLWTDAKLKALDLYVPGKPHAMDATRQVLFYEVTVLGDNYWIERYGEATR